VRDELAARWSREKDALQRVGDIKRQIDELRMEAEREERAGNLARVAEIRYGILPQLEKELEERERRTEAPMVKEEVDEDDVAAVVSSWTGFPSPDCSKARSRSSSTWRSGSPARRRPGSGRRGGRQRASPGALGPAGSQPADRLVHLPRADRRRKDRARPALAEFMFDDERAMVRLDMSEYQERHTVAGSSARRPATSATRRAASSPRRATPPVHGRPARRDREGAREVFDVSCSCSTTDA
jgi:ATP-dependent Clp protease ATP-binding subunit ClpB